MFQSSIGSPDKYYREDSDFNSFSSNLSSERKFYTDFDENRVCIKMFHISHFILVLSLLLFCIIHKLTILQVL